MKKENDENQENETEAADVLDGQGFVMCPHLEKKLIALNDAQMTQAFLVTHINV